MAFTLSIHPWVYLSKYDDGTWTEEFREQEHLTPEAEAALPEAERTALMARRNSFPDLPLVNYTTQYGMGCFEGLKAFPQKNGGLALFRPDENSRRMARSMEGLAMPPVDPDTLTKAILEVVRRNTASGFTMGYDSAWEADHYLTAGAVYLRPFSYSEPGIGVNLSKNPWVIVVATPVSAYFEPGTNAAVTTEMIRATPHGTGWIKCDANYVTSTLAKYRAIEKGYMEAIFLDATHRRYIEEGSSCNFFCLRKDGTLVTPALGETILPGITRASVLQLAADRDIPTEERDLAVDEVLDEGDEVFVTGTAAGVTPLYSLTHEGRKVTFRGGQTGPVTEDLMQELKGIQYGAVEDRYGWMFPVD